MTLSLGCHDPALPRSDVEALFERLRAVSGNPDEACLVDDAGERVFPRPLGAAEPFSVAEVQEALARIGFFPSARVDGICGYRTRAAIRLFQEYVRSIEGRPCAPDGKISAISPDGGLRWMEVEGRMNGERFVEFLEAMVKGRSKPIYLIVDGHPAHKAKVVTRWLEKNEKRLKMFVLPGVLAAAQSRRAGVERLEEPHDRQEGVPHALAAEQAGARAPGLDARHAFADPLVLRGDERSIRQGVR